MRKRSQLFCVKEIDLIIFILRKSNHFLLFKFDTDTLETAIEECTTPGSSEYGSTVLNTRRRKSNITKTFIDKVLPVKENQL